MLRTLIISGLFSLLPALACAQESSVSGGHKFYSLNRSLASSSATLVADAPKFYSLSRYSVSRRPMIAPAQPQNKKLGDYMKSAMLKPAGASSSVAAVKAAPLRRSIVVAANDKLSRDPKLDNDNYPAKLHLSDADRKSSIVHSWPMEPVKTARISSPFGWREDPFKGSRAFHAGMDIAAPVGTAVLASADGKVDGVGSHARLGKFVRVTHSDGSYSLYGHLSAQSVNQGDSVAAGDKVGEVGATGRATGPHLDYSLRIHGEPVNPLLYVKRKIPSFPSL